MHLLVSLDGKPAGLAGMVKPEIPTSLPKFSNLLLIRISN